MLKLLPVILSFIILAAHFFRAELLPIAILYVLIPFLLFIKAAWVPRFMQLFLILGTVEWVRTLLVLIAERQALGQPWHRLIIILGVVALFTLVSALVFQSKTIKERYLQKK